MGRKDKKKMHMAHIRLTHFSVQQRIARHGKETVCVCVCAHMCSVTQSCPPDCDPTDCSPPGYSVHGIFQARILEWVAIFPSPEDLPDPGIKPVSPALAGIFFTTDHQGSPLFLFTSPQILSLRWHPPAQPDLRPPNFRPRF